MTGATEAAAPHTGVWATLIGHDDVLPQLQRAALAATGGIFDGSSMAMTHAWLFAGPAGSGRSIAALALAAALQCDAAGCGECPACSMSTAGTHPDIEHVVPTAVTYKADEVRALAQRAASLPLVGRWRVIVLEDADRLNESSANALLKAIEEPAERTVWMLCAPSAADVLSTIASRCRQIPIHTPSMDVVAAELQRRYSIDAPMAMWAARAAQGHVGRAALLARDEQARARRRAVLDIPARLTSLARCFEAAKALVATAQADADAVAGVLDEREREAVLAAYGEGAQGKGLSAANVRARGELSRLAKQQEARARRILRDEYDRALLDLLGFYRDVWLVQSGVSDALINTDLEEAITAFAAHSSADASVARMNAITEASARLRTNAAALLVFEALFVCLWDTSARQSSQQGV